MKVLKGRSNAALKDGVWKPSPPVTWENKGPRVIRQAFKGITYKMREVLDNDTVTGFEIFAEDDEEMKVLKGRSKATLKEGVWKPAPPVTWV